MTDEAKLPPPTPPPEPDDSGAKGSRPKPRDLLLARAADPLEDAGGSDAPAPTVPGAPSDEWARALDEVAASPSPGRRRTAAPRTALSPQLQFLAATLVGGATLGMMLLAVARILPRDELAWTLTSAQPRVVETALPEPSAPPAPSAPVQRRQRNQVPGPWRIANEAGKSGVRILKGEFQRRAFLTALQDSGISKSDAYRVFGLLKDIKDLNRCGSKDHFEALLSDGQLTAFEYVSTPEEVYQARLENGTWTAKLLDMQVKRERITAAFSFKGELEASASEAGLEPGLSRVLIKALDGHVDTSDLQTGDRFRVVALEMTVLGGFARYAGVEAVEYLPYASDEKARRIYYVEQGTKTGYFNADGETPFMVGWRKPIPGAAITSPFNPQRMHPILHRRMPHNGTDFGCSAGVPVGAAKEGKVTFMGNGGGYGNLVRVTHPGGVETGYAHLLRFAEGLKLGDKVKTLQLVGYCGSTGRSTGPHLHFETRKDGKFFDSRTLNLDGRQMVSTGDKAGFAKAKVEYDQLLDGIALPPRLEPAATPAPAAPGQEVFEQESPADPSGTGAPPPVAPTTTAPAAPPRNGRPSIYLSDDELEKTQGGSNDGEVP